jgi:hypothetical protein
VTLGQLPPNGGYARKLIPVMMKSRPHNFVVLQGNLMKSIRIAILASAIGACFSVIAQTNCQSDGFGGTRCNNGGGYQSDGFGGTRGTGNNSGGGWQSDGFGGTRGTGNNSGRNCQSDGFGGVRCN